MGLQLESVELKNIRSQGSFTLNPKNKGITVISGENGTGKSTIVNSVAWVLFGTKPKGVGKISSLMKSDVPFEKDKFFAEVILKVDDDYIKVKRSFVNKGGKTECDVWRSSDKKNWTHESGPSVSHSEPYIRKVLKIDEKGFLSAVFVQQKQVDQLITASPKERSEVIEKLTGISTITTAISEARSDYNATRKLIDKTDINIEELERLEKEEVEKTKNLERLKKEVEERQEKVRLEEKELLTLSTTLQKEEQELELSRSLKQSIEFNKEKVKDKKAELDRVILEKDYRKGQLSTTAKASNLDEVYSNLQEENKKLKNIVQSIVEIKFNISNLQEQERFNRDILEKSKLKDLSTAQAEQIKNRKNISKAEDNIKLLTEEKFSEQALLRNLLQAVKVIGENNGSCPTCMQIVTDVPKTVATLETQAEQIKESLIKTEKTISTTDHHLHIFRENEEKFEQLIQAFTAEDLQAEIKSLEKKKLDLEVSERLTNEKIEGLQKILAEAKNYQNIKADYERSLKIAQEETLILEGLEKDLKSRELELSRLSTLPVNEVKKLRREYDLRSSELNNDKQSLIKMQGDLNLEEERVKFLQKEISFLREEYERYKKLLNSVELSLNTVKVLEEFREDRVEHSVPVIEAYASEFLSNFTNNTFSGLELDSKFNTTVILPNGEKRDVGLLSGGELSTAALSLRLAITFLLNSDDENNLLILDEVLVSQDSERVQNILNNIKKVFKGQVILIAHNDSIREIADKVIELK